MLGRGLPPQSVLHSPIATLYVEPSVVLLRVRLLGALGLKHEPTAAAAKPNAAAAPLHAHGGKELRGGGGGGGERVDGGSSCDGKSGSGGGAAVGTPPLVDAVAGWAERLPKNAVGAWVGGTAVSWARAWARQPSPDERKQQAAAVAALQSGWDGGGAAAAAAAAAGSGSEALKDEKAAAAHAKQVCGAGGARGHGRGKPGIVCSGLPCTACGKWMQAALSAAAGLAPIMCSGLLGYGAGLARCGRCGRFSG
eukprot:93861-Chlamydomonas_euryale.AAC.1